MAAAFARPEPSREERLPLEVGVEKPGNFAECLPRFGSVGIGQILRVALTLEHL